MFSICFLYMYSHQIALCFSNIISPSIRKYTNLLFLSLSPSLTLNVLTYPLILGIIKINGLMSLSIYPVKYLELDFVLTNFKITILLIITSQVFIGFLQQKTFLLLLLSLQILTLLYYEKKKNTIIF